MDDDAAARGPTIAPEVADLVGTVTRSYTSDPVSLRHIREYLVGTGASTSSLPEPDDAAGIAELVAPPLFFLSACRPVVGEHELLEDGQHRGLGVPGVEGRSLVAGTRSDFLGDIHVGDVLHATERLVSVTPRDGRSGPIVFVEVETEYRNQHDDLVVVHAHTYAFR